ncbi:MAG: tyrosine-type recombinase/integrase, partial [Candidatus Pacebacteria bacterium]|nr:tyrosine-type recombinase/integrase [Candidatus Paceibacterota bacterium]
VSKNGDRGLSEGGLIHWVRKYKKLSGVNFHLHKFRHTFACNLGTQNVSAIKVQKLMGHEDLRMTQRYLRSMTVDDLRDDINRLSVDNLV